MTSPELLVMEGAYFQLNQFLLLDQNPRSSALGDKVSTDFSGVSVLKLQDLNRL